MVISSLYFVLLISQCYSYSSHGVWQNTTPAHCKMFSYCPRQSNMVWKSPAFERAFDSHSFCELVQEKQFRSIIFVGNSQLRHVALGLSLIASGDFLYGGLRVRNRKCSGDMQFSEKKCGPSAFSTTVMKFCEDEVTVKHYWPGNFYKAVFRKIISPRTDTLIIWSEGADYIRPADKYGKYDPLAYQQILVDGMGGGLLALCGEGHTTYRRRNVVWMSSHHQPGNSALTQPDESPDRIEVYNNEMRQFFLSGQCGSVTYVDVWNMTYQLAMEHTDLLQYNSFDMYHYTLPVNVLKAQLLLNHIFLNHIHADTVN